MRKSGTLDENKAAMKRIVAIFTTGDLSAVDEVIAPDYLDHQGLGGITMRGQEGFRQVVTAVHAALPQLHVVIHDVIAEDDTVVARLRWHSIDTAGKAIDRETIEILRFVDRRAVEHWGAESWACERG